MSKKEPTIQDVLSAINDYASHNDAQISGIKGEISGIKGEISGIKGEISGIKADLTKIKATMVTKDYLDTKLADLRGDLVVLTRKEDGKLKTLIEMLGDKKVLDNKEVKKLLTMEPFPQLAL